MTIIITTSAGKHIEIVGAVVHHPLQEANAPAAVLPAQARTCSVATLTGDIPS